MIKRLHHVSMKSSNDEEYATAIHFYRDLLGLRVAHQWSNGLMFDTGNGYIEVFNNGKGALPVGAVRHYAFEVDDVDEMISKLRNEGYEVTVEPEDIVLNCDPPLPLRIAFIIGPLGEEIEFLKER